MSELEVSVDTLKNYAVNLVWNLYGHWIPPRATIYWLVLDGNRKFRQKM